MHTGDTVTIEFWVARNPQMLQGPLILERYLGSAEHKGLEIRDDANGNAWGAIYAGSPWPEQLAPVPFPADSDFHHLAFTRHSDGTFALFLDGHPQLVAGPGPCWASCGIIEAETTTRLRGNGWIIDELRWSSVDRYPDVGFTPSKSWPSDQEVAMLLDFNEGLGDLVWDSGTSNQVGQLSGSYSWLEVEDIDADDDGISNDDELFIYGTDPCLFDTDGDGLSDGVEIGLTQGTIDTDQNVFLPDLDPTTTTNPLSSDSDGGGVEDGIEDVNKDGRMDSWETDPNLGNDEEFAFYVRNFNPGQRVTCEIYNGRPMALACPAYSITGHGPTGLGIGVDMDLSPPIHPMQPQVIDFGGRASWLDQRIPSSTPLGLNVWMQAVEIPFSNDSPRVSNSILLPVGSN